MKTWITYVSALCTCKIQDYEWEYCGYDDGFKINENSPLLTSLIAALKYYRRSQDKQ
jgi:hypothetical protein